MIRFSGVNKSFGKKRVLVDLDLVLEAGKIVFILGKSGTGKSVLLKHIVGLVQPDKGEVWVEDKPVFRLSEAELMPIRRHCGMVFQNPALLESFTVYENLALGLRAHKVVETEKAERRRVEETLDLVELENKILEQFPTELSFGMQKRVSLARTLAVQPRYLLFDEPTTAQDPIATRTINSLIQHLATKAKVTCVVVSHDMPSALSVAERIVVLDQGTLVDDGTPDELLKSRVPLTREFLEEAR